MDSNRRPAGYEPAAIDQLSYVAVNRIKRKVLVAGAGFEPRDLRVMSPTSYLAAPPRDILPKQLIHFIRFKAVCQLFLHRFIQITKYLFLFFS